MEYLDQYTSQSDLTNFLNRYRPDASGFNIPVESLNGAVNIPANPGLEAMLDVETVVAATYPLRSKVYNFGNDFTQGDLFSLTFQHFIKAQDQPGVLSVSFGGVESYFPPQEIIDQCYNAQKLSSLGVTLVFASGDGGVSGFQPSNKCPPFDATVPGCHSSRQLEELKDSPKRQFHLGMVNTTAAVASPPFLKHQLSRSLLSLLIWPLPPIMLQKVLTEPMAKVYQVSR